jgi:hypothetical protein
VQFGGGVVRAGFSIVLISGPYRRFRHRLRPCLDLLPALTLEIRRRRAARFAADPRVHELQCQSLSRSCMPMWHGTIG